MARTSVLKILAETIDCLKFIEQLNTQVPSKNAGDSSMTDIASQSQFAGVHLVSESLFIAEPTSLITTQLPINVSIVEMPSNNIGIVTEHIHIQSLPSQTQEHHQICCLFPKLQREGMKDTGKAKSLAVSRHKSVAYYHKIDIYHHT